MVVVYSERKKQKGKGDVTHTDEISHINKHTHPFQPRHPLTPDQSSIPHRQHPHQRLRWITDLHKIQADAKVLPLGPAFAYEVLELLGSRFGSAL